MAEGTVVVHHWLHHDCHFNVKVEKEPVCRWCVHLPMCSVDMSKMCKNFWFGSGGEKHCQACSHHYTRYENKQPIACFACWFFDPRGGHEQYRNSDWFELWCQPDTSDNWWRLGILTRSVMNENDKLQDYIEKNHKKIIGAVPGRPLEFVPLLEYEFEYHLHKIETSGNDWLANFTLEMIGA